jgi:hypothetical protein
MGTIPTPPTIATNQFVTSAVMNQYRDAINFWALTPRCYAWQNSAMTLTTGTWTVVPLQAEVYDIVQSGDSPMHDNTTNNSRIFARTAGKYEIAAQVQFDNNATSWRQIQVRINAAGSQAGGTLVAVNTQSAVNGISTSAQIVPVEAALAVGDYIELFADQNSGGNLLTLAASSAQTYLRMKLTGT